MAYVTFKDKLGAVLTTTLNTGLADYADFSIVLDGTGVGDLAGTITLTRAGTSTAVKIGEVAWSSASGITDYKFYAGTATNVTVNNGDTFAVNITGPITTTATIQVARFQPTATDIANLKQWGQAGALCIGNFPTLPRKTAIRETIEGLAVLQESFSIANVHSKSDHVQALRNFFNNAYDKPMISAQAYYTASDLSAALSTVHPPTQQDIFNTWDRFQADQFFPKGVGATSDAAAWTYDSDAGTVVQPNNTGSYVGFTSAETPTVFDLEVTCTSNNGDDDFITIVMAFVRDTATSQNHTLDLVLCGPNASNWGTPRRDFWPDISVVTDLVDLVDWSTQTGRYKEYYTNIVQQQAGWSSRYRRVKVSRRGDVFVTQVSDWGAVTFNPNYTYVLDLNDHPELAIFKGGSAYGYGSWSQPNTTYKDVSYISNVNQNIILDMLNNQVYLWSGTAWVLQSNMKVTDLYSGPRTIQALSDGAKYRISAAGVITKL